MAVCLHHDHHTVLQLLETILRALCCLLVQRCEKNFDIIFTRYDNYKGDKREGTHKLPTYKEPNTDHLEIFRNYQLQLPSQRLRELDRLKVGISQWQKDRAAKFELQKQHRVLHNRHKMGILGIDAPHRAGTELYSER